MAVAAVQEAAPLVPSITTVTMVATTLTIEVVLTNTIIINRRGTDRRETDLRESGHRATDLRVSGHRATDHRVWVGPRRDRQEVGADGVGNKAYRHLIFMPILANDFTSPGTTKDQRVTQYCVTLFCPLNS